MKKTSSFAPTLLIFFTLVFLSNAFAQGLLFEPRVSLIYFLPKDRPARPDRITALQALLQDTQAFFADEMERHGYGRKTFTLETDKKGEPVVHQIHGKFNDAHYRRQLEAIDEVWTEVKAQFDSPQRIYFIAIDINSEMFVPWGGAGKGYYEQRGKGALMAASGDGFNLPLAAHELGHAFALEHDFRDPVYIMSYGRNRHQLSECAAVWLDAHIFFNNALAQVNRDARIQMLSPTAAPNGIRLRFEVADADGLHQAMLYLKPTPADPARDFKLDGCRLLDAESDTVEFVTSELIDPFQDEVTLQVIDKHGGMTRQTFPINIAPILPPPKVVSIPDPNLAAALRKALGLNGNARIFERYLRSLTELDARNSQIKNLTGLEHATRLRSLELRENQITDIRPLANLKSLQKLILDDNNVSDINPLANLTQLTWLLLGNNPISDFTPLDNLNHLEGLALWGGNFSNTVLLADMPQLTHLWLGSNKINDITSFTNLTELKILYLPHNQIRDVTPLAGLANLETLHLQDNSIHDMSPLTGLTKLTDLRLGDNPITDKSPLRILKAQNPNLKVDIEIPLTELTKLAEDINSDGVVNIQDLVLVASNFGQKGKNAADVNGDGVVNITDLVKVAGALGNAAAPSLYFQRLETLTATDVQQWLTEAQDLNLTDATAQRGIRFLEQFLAVLMPKESALLPNYPNPFNPETWIPYQLAKASDVKITIYDARGVVVRLLDLGHQAPGFYTRRSRAAYWDGRNTLGERVASGIYFYQLMGNVSPMRKMLILK